MKKIIFQKYIIILFNKFTFSYFYCLGNKLWKLLKTKDGKIKKM